VALTLHARRLIAPGTRRRIARTLMGMVDATQGRSSAPARPRGLQVAQAAPELIALAERLQRRLDVLGDGRVARRSAQLGHADQHRELIVHPVLEHHAKLVDEAEPSEPRMPAHGPNEESLQPDQERQCESLGAAVELRKGEQHGQQDTGSREHQLKVLGELRLHDVSQGAERDHDDLGGKWLSGDEM
jgi:hypothetical protein